MGFLLDLFKTADTPKLPKLGGKMSLLEEIRADVVNASMPLPSVLRKAKILAYKLRSDDLKRWVEQELGGYDCDSEQLPIYRRNETFSLGDFVTRFAQISKSSSPGRPLQA